MSEPQSDIELTTSSDGIEYPVLQIPENEPKPLTLEVVDYVGPADLDDIGGYPVHHIYVTCTEISNSKLPLDANPREPSRTAQVEAMHETLDNEPADFIKKNNGMAMLCGSIEAHNGDDPQKVTLTFNPDEGICNGGHTYFAIQTHEDLPEEAGVQMEVMELPESLQGDERREEITNISGARNNNNRLDNRSEADFLGYYDYLKAQIDDDRVISWHEGDSNAYDASIDAVHYLRLLKSQDPFAYKHPVCNETGSPHKALATTRSRIHTNWMDQMRDAMMNETKKPLYYLAPHANDLLYLRDLISHSLKYDDLSSGFRRTRFYQDYVKNNPRDLNFDNFDHDDGIDLKQTLEVLFLGLFRTDMYVSPPEKGEVKYTGWYIAPEDLWHDRKVNMCDAMGQYFNEVDNDPKQFIRVSAPFERDLFTLGLRQDPPDPDFLYDIAENDRYARTENASAATHWLQTSDESDQLVSLTKLDPDDGATLYEPHSGGLSLEQ